MVVLGPEESAKLAKTSHKSVTSVLEPDKHIYGIAMYQQLRCLNTIRKSFYRAEFYPYLTDNMFQSQKSMVPLISLYEGLLLTMVFNI